MKSKVSTCRDKLRVTKRFCFDAAHALLNYDGPCRNIHGHSYVLQITILGTTMKTEGHPKNGLVIDFSDIKKAVQQKIVDHYDHALLLNNSTSGETVRTLEKEYDKILLLPFQPSCENLVMDIRNRFAEVFNDKCKLFSIRLQETENSWAEWHLTDNPS
jgi:6-pyruvoyltetrahydropterin/6-carboxytetrahydropterin synthase